MFTRRGEENRPFLNLGKRRERRGVFQNDWGSNPDCGILWRGSESEGGLIPELFPAAFDHLLVYTQLPGSKSQLKVDYKAMKQHCYEGRVTPIHFFLIWWPIQGVRWHWDGEGGSWKSLLTSVVATKSGFWGEVFPPGSAQVGAPPQQDFLALRKPEEKWNSPKKERGKGAFPEKVKALFR